MSKDWSQRESIPRRRATWRHFVGTDPLDFTRQEAHCAVVGDEGYPIVELIYPLPPSISSYQIRREKPRETRVRRPVISIVPLVLP